MPNDAVDYAFEAWTKRYNGTKPTWHANGGRQVKALAKIAKDLGHRFPGAWDVYLMDQHPCYQGHPPTLFAKNPDRWTIKAQRHPQRPLIQLAEDGEVMSQAEARAMLARRKAAAEAEAQKRRGTVEALRRHYEPDREAAKDAIKKIRGK